MFSQIAQPLAYAESLLGMYCDLGQARDEASLLADFVRAVARLSACELSQLYLLDATHTHLGLCAEHLQGAIAPRAAEALPADYNDEQLLQFCLCQNRVLHLLDLGSGLYRTDFLPEVGGPWHSLLCVPLSNAQGAVQGLLLCASRTPAELQGFAGSLGLSGSFLLAQLSLRQHWQRSAAAAQVAPAVQRRASDYGLIGKSPAMRETCQLISKVLHSPYTVLLQGETGTGKEVVARAIHDYGPRRSQPFIVQNCAALPEHLLESELFGYRKGAFTGADSDRIGLFEAANGGTLLLDEVGDMPPALQAKLLRVLQESEIRPLGANDTRKIDVRIIAATHRDLPSLVSSGEFREDLYYRLGQFPIELPALRQREGDIPRLARYFCDRTCAFLQRETLAWSDTALQMLGAYAFPGNVRELKGLVERAVLLCDGRELLPEHLLLRGSARVDTQSLNLRLRMEQVERGLLLECLHKHAGNRTHAARELGMSRRALHYRLARLKIQPQEQQESCL
ncbi:sigma-54 interaction domain-containing protein [Pseudomonas protegens]|uniref:sigma-54 interaction domain-containing protein n=1 Tax=Pseudomonas protegens TaxID=380021 RepID=UPI001B30EB58|nr:sigma 54-interacting transcriptional regulator [Pseudomonas protegens]MBP5119452.1 sigma 54-interacting transcriptional regulator [Pseudomonas protegens]MBP5126038.1 sigma 54-interacting transcriptional regulator [Pseudomonas protegens]QTU20463.1 sigma 54-interacting transcriptional regulator [Pseudomonas protegens]